VSVLTKQISMPSLSVPRLRKSANSPKASRAKGGAITGLEIGATQLIAAQSRLEDGAIVAERIAARSVPHGLMRDGLIVDAPRLASELKLFFAENHLSKRVRVGLATPRTVLRVIDLPPLESKDVHAALMMQAQERIPMPLDTAVMDHQTVGLVDTPEGQRLRVIVVATEREGVVQLLDTLRRAGLKPQGIDLSIFAAIRALPVDRVHGPVLYAQLGDLVNIAIAEAGVCRFTRQAPQGLALVLERLAENRGIPTEEAYAALMDPTPGLPAETPAVETPAADTPAAEGRETADVLSRVAAELGSELRAAAEFYSTQFGSAVVSAGVVAGPLATLPGFVQELSVASGLEIVCGEAQVADANTVGDVDPRLAAVASGLSIGVVA
jgi:type IV pilus assembly protein PilM